MEPVCKQSLGQRSGGFSVSVVCSGNSTGHRVGVTGSDASEHPWHLAGSAVQEQDRLWAWLSTLSPSYLEVPASGAGASAQTSTVLSQNPRLQQILMSTLLGVLTNCSLASSPRENIRYANRQVTQVWGYHCSDPSSNIQGQHLSIMRPMTGERLPGLLSVLQQIRRGPKFLKSPGHRTS